MLSVLHRLCSLLRAQTAAQTPTPAKASLMLRDEARLPSIVEAQGQDIGPQPTPSTLAPHGDNNTQADLD